MFHIISSYFDTLSPIIRLAYMLSDTFLPIRFDADAGAMLPPHFHFLHA